MHVNDDDEGFNCGLIVLVMVLVTFVGWFFYKLKQFWGKCACSITSLYWTIKKDYSQSNFVHSIKSFCQQIFKVNFEQISRHHSHIKCHVSFKMRASFVNSNSVIFEAEKVKETLRTRLSRKHNYRKNSNHCSHPINIQGKLEKWNKYPFLLSTIPKAASAEGVLVWKI